MLMVWNGAGRNGESIFGARNAQRTNAAVAHGLPNFLARLLGSRYGGIALNSFWHCTHIRSIFVVIIN